jgi:biotin transporter BioY
MDRLFKLLTDIDQANVQRRYWLFASSFVVVSIVGYILGWHWLQALENPYIDWILISAGLLISMNWWYWTMKLVRQYLIHQVEVITLLDDIVNDLKIIKEEVKSLNSVDNDT